MEEYYECRHSFHLEKTKAPRCYLQYKSLFGPEQEIPLILVNDDGNIFEFFTKTKFISEKNGYYWCFKLPNSTLSYGLNSSCANYSTKILPADALKKLEPFMKKPSKCIGQINSYFDWFKNEFIQKQQEIERTNKANPEAQSILSKFWKNH